MDRPVAIGGFSGVASTIAYTLLKGLAEDSAIPVNLPTLECPEIINLESAPWGLFLAGVGCGLLVGPALDLLWLFRQKWRRFIWRIIAAEQVAPCRLHKVLA